jgi:cell division protein FtsB
MIRLKITEKLPPAFRNKYFLTIIIFLIWLLLFDSNNLVSRFRDMREMKKLSVEKELYTERVKSERRKLKELQTSNRNLEKFAREEYKMKRSDEDVYIILTPQENRRIKRRND